MVIRYVLKLILEMFQANSVMFWVKFTQKFDRQTKPVSRNRVKEARFFFMPSLSPPVSSDLQKDKLNKGLGNRNPAILNPLFNLSLCRSPGTAPTATLHATLCESSREPHKLTTNTTLSHLRFIYCLWPM